MWRILVNLLNLFVSRVMKRAVEEEDIGVRFTKHSELLLAELDEFLAIPIGCHVSNYQWSRLLSVLGQYWKYCDNPGTQDTKQNTPPIEFVKQLDFYSIKYITKHFHRF